MASKSKPVVGKPFIPSSLSPAASRKTSSIRQSDYHSSGDSDPSYDPDTSDSDLDKEYSAAPTDDDSVDSSDPGNWGFRPVDSQIAVRNQERVRNAMRLYSLRHGASHAVDY
jgi:hypothetical protein